MTQDKSKSPDQEASTVNSDPSLNKQAVDEVVNEYEQSTKSDEKELDLPTQKQLGRVERALEDTVLGIEDAS